VNDIRTVIRPADPALLEVRVAARLAGALKQQADALPPGVEARLRFAREQALECARAARASSVQGVGGGVAALGRLGAWWPRLGALLPVMVLALGTLLLVDQRQREEVAVAAEIDAALLADDLPPQAYADPGFVAFLKLQQP
jgi:Protein of unknown function (DUF3619)